MSKLDEMECEEPQCLWWFDADQGRLGLYTSHQGSGTSPCLDGDVYIAKRQEELHCQRLSPLLKAGHVHAVSIWLSFAWSPRAQARHLTHEPSLSTVMPVDPRLALFHLVFVVAMLPKTEGGMGLQGWCIYRWFSSSSGTVAACLASGVHESDAPLFWGHSHTGGWSTLAGGRSASQIVAGYLAWHPD